MYTLINGSQKNKDSNSSYFLNYISEYLDEFVMYDLKKDTYEDILHNIKLSNSIVLAFPLYVDSPNSLTLEFLDYIYDENIDFDDKRLYVVINCGFREGEQNRVALDIIKNWCIKVGAKYSGAILIGAGEIVGKKKYKFVSKKAYKKLHEFSVCVSSNKRCDDLIASMDLLNNKAYCILANYSWNKKARKNKLNINDVKEI